MIMTLQANESNKQPDGGLTARQDHNEEHTETFLQPISNPLKNH